MSKIVETTENVELAEVSEQETPVVLTVVEGGVTEETTEEQPEEVDFVTGAMRIAHAIRGVFQSGNEPVAILVHPSLQENLMAAFRQLPDEAIPPQVRDNLQFVPDPNVNPCRIITSYDMTMQFLMRRYGPRNQDGNGLLEAMSQVIQMEGSKVRITDEFLINYYLFEVAERVKPRILVPGASEVIRNLQLVR